MSSIGVNISVSYFFKSFYVKIGKKTTLFCLSIENQAINRRCSSFVVVHFTTIMKNSDLKEGKLRLKGRLMRCEFADVVG